MFPSLQTLDPKAGCADACKFNNKPASPGSNETLPYGIQMVLGSSGPGPVSLIGSDVLLCILDSGIYTKHPDLVKNVFEGCTATSNNTECNQFPYDKPNSLHGTHITGTIAAVRNNNGGVLGVIADRADIFGAQVLPDGNGGPLSLTLEGMSQCEAEVDARKAKGRPARAVVNMSFGTADKVIAFQEVMDRLSARGDMLFIAAAGNEQLQFPGQLVYPAAYRSAVSVGAVDCNGVVAPFSQRNKEVDLVAPGVNILSTILPMKFDSIKAAATSAASKQNITLVVTPMKKSGYGSVTAPLVSCGLASAPCADAKGKVCLIARGITPFGCKVRNAQLGGCAAVIIHNNLEPSCTPLEEGTLVTKDCTPLKGAFPPTVAITLEEGRMLKNWLLKGAVKATVAVLKGTKNTLYGEQTGTSMSVPHVTGIAARIWADFPKCTALDVRTAMEQGAKDIAPKGRDKATGMGLVNLQGAYEKLSKMTCAAGTNTNATATADIAAVAAAPSTVPIVGTPVAPKRRS